MEGQQMQGDLGVGLNRGTEIDYKRIAFRALKYWYVVVISLIISLTGAYLINRYAVRIYTVTASVLVSGKEGLGGAEILYNNSIVNSHRNYLDEPYIIRSYPLIEGVISKLNFDVAFYKEGNIKTTEAYGLPIKVKLLIQNGSYGASLIFKALDEKSYSISSLEEKNGANEKRFNFNDSVEYRGHHFIVLRNPRQSIRAIINEPFKLTFLNPKSVAGSYIGGLSITWAEEGSGVLNLAVNGSNPSKNIDFINGVIEMYQKYDLDKKNQIAERTIQFLKKQLAEISDSLKIFESKLLKFKIQNAAYGSSAFMSLGTTIATGSSVGKSGKLASDMSDDVATRLYTELISLEAQRTDLIIRSNYFDYLEKLIRENKNLDLMVLPSALGIQDDVLNGLVKKLIDIQLQVKLQLEKGLKENPEVQTGVKEHGEIREYMIKAIEELRTADQFKANILLPQIAELKSQIDQLPIELTQFISIQRSYSLLENLYLFLMQKMSEADISRASNVSDISVVNPPMLHGTIAPKVSQNYTWGFLIGLLVPIGIFTLIEVLNQRIQSKEDIEKTTTIPFIGGIWHHDAISNLAVSDKPKSAVAESFRAIRSNLNYFTGNKLKKVFLVTSSVSGEGKSFSTINLATVFAMSGKRTLIIGADMRKPKIYQDFDLGNSKGLSGYLSQLNTFEEIIQPTAIENLDIISGGPVPPNPSELLLTSHFETLIKQALSIYDYIIIDTPPLAIVTDAFVLAKYADHTVFVVRQNYTEKAFLRDIQDFYTSGKLKNISLVLNDIYKTGYGYGYGYGYSYGYGKKKYGEGYYS